MTIAIGWIRQVNSCQELIIASDSRLCGGHRWDQCPKILTMPRSDCAICFAGSTVYAYPMMMQVYFAAGEYSKLADRAMDIVEFNGYVLKNINHLYRAIYDSANPKDIFENEFIFGGYSWVEKQFKLWRYHYDKHDKRFSKFSSSGLFHGKKFGEIVFAGDKKREFVNELYMILSAKYGKALDENNGKGYDMEPLEALISLLRKSDKDDTIGGAPQIVKIYQHMNCRPVGVYWPFKKEDQRQNRTLLGRKLFEFEHTDYWFMNPETLRTEPNLFINEVDRII